MKTLKNWTVDTQSANHLELLVDNQHRLCLYVLEENLFRVLIKRKGERCQWLYLPGLDADAAGKYRDGGDGAASGDHPPAPVAGVALPQ